ncbi:MAG: type II secretion system F family protein [Micrococcales bacterium]
MQNWAPYLFAVVISACVFFIAAPIFARREREQKQRTLANLRKYDSRKRSQEVVLEPQSYTILYGAVKRFLPKGYREWLLGRVRAAGNHSRDALDHTLNQKALFASAGIVVGVLFFTKGLSDGFTYTLGFTLLGYFVPDILLINTAQKRQLEIEQGLPDAIDLLALCVESGLTFEQAAGRVSIGLDGPVAQEFGALLGEMQLGNSRTEAVALLMKRSKSPGFIRFLSALLQVDRLGIPMSSVLQEQAREMRATRKDNAREQAQKVTVKILMPLMFCFLPAVFIVIIGPAIVGLMQSFASIG